MGSALILTSPSPASPGKPEAWQAWIAWHTSSSKRQRHCSNGLAPTGTGSAHMTQIEKISWPPLLATGQAWFLLTLGHGILCFVQVDMYTHSVPLLALLLLQRERGTASICLN